MDIPNNMPGKNPAECGIWGGKDSRLVPEKNRDLKDISG